MFSLSSTLIQFHSPPSSRVFSPFTTSLRLMDYPDSLSAIPFDVALGKGMQLCQSSSNTISPLRLSRAQRGRTERGRAMTPSPPTPHSSSKDESILPFYTFSRDSLFPFIQNPNPTYNKDLF